MYLPKLLKRAASIGALSTETISFMISGERSAKVIAVFAPLIGLQFEILF
jgi:hypothetical protein